MKESKRSDRFYMSSVKLGPKCQIVIPKEVREMFSLNSGDSLVLLADKERGIALQTVDRLEPAVRIVFEQTEKEGEEN